MVTVWETCRQAQDLLQGVIDSQRFHMMECDQKPAKCLRKKPKYRAKRRLVLRPNTIKSIAKKANL